MGAQHGVLAFAGRDLPPAARRTDDLTSHLAAREFTASGKREYHCAIVLSAVKAHPGRTSLELSLRCSLNRFDIARRLPDLLAAGFVRKGERRHCEVTGKLALTWWPNDDTTALLAAA